MSKDKQPKDLAEQGNEIKTAADLKQDEHNYRKHSETNKARIKKSIDEAGLGRSVVIDADGVLVAGNGVQQVIDKDTPVRVVETDGTELVVVKRTDLHTGDPRRKTLALADNATADDVEWDFDAIAEDWAEDELEDWGVDWPADEEEIEQKEAHEDDFDPDKPVETVCKKGDIWKLGNHRLMCGDSTDAASVALLMDGKRADLVFTDPPYGMNLDTDYSSMQSKLAIADEKHLKGGNKYDAGHVDDFTPDMVQAVLNLDAKETFIWGADYFAELIPNRNDGSFIVWDKRANEGGTIERDESSDKMFGSCFELCWSKAKHKRDIARVKWAGIFGMEQEPDRKRVHPTQKPIALVAWFLNRYGKEGDIVADIFGGSGTTLIAAEQLNRKCYMMELDPHYCDVIIARWEKLTGNKAEKLK